MPEKSTTEIFIEKAISKHGNKYDYSTINYLNNRTKIEIVCPLHGSFTQTPHDHLKPRGCPSCGGKKKQNTEIFIKRAHDIHGEKYDYTLSEYVDMKTPVIIICKEHGRFEQIPDSHLRGNGCGRCNIRQTESKEYFVKRAQEVHGDIYDYSKTVYINSNTKVSIGCRKHGEFIQHIKHHYAGQGCPQCFNRQSKPELEVLALVMNMAPDLEIQTSISPAWMDGKRELDVYISSKNFAIEYNGDYWHSEKFGRDEAWHRRKSDEAKANGITLLHVWDSKWNSDYRDIYISIIEHFINGKTIDRIEQLIEENIWMGGAG